MRFGIIPEEIWTFPEVTRVLLEDALASCSSIRSIVSYPFGFPDTRLHFSRRFFGDHLN